MMRFFQTMNCWRRNALPLGLPLKNLGLWPSGGTSATSTHPTIKLSRSVKTELGYVASYARTNLCFAIHSSAAAALCRIY